MICVFTCSNACAYETEAGDEGRRGKRETNPDRRTKRGRETQRQRDHSRDRRRLTGQVLVLATQGLGAVVGLLQLGLDPEQLSAVAARLLLRVLQLRLQVVHLGLPLRHRLVERALLLLQVVGVGVGLGG